MNQAPSPSLELGDIQSGALHERPSPYVGTYFFFRMHDARAGRELIRRLYPAVDSYHGAASTSHDAWLTVGVSYSGLKVLGVPQSVTGHLRARVPPGNGGAGSRVG